MSPTLSAQSGDACFRLAMASSGIGMAIVDLDGRWREVNPVLERMLGVSAGALPGHPVVERIHPQDAAGAGEAFRALASGAVALIDRRQRYLRHDGTSFAGHVNAALMRDDAGAPAFVVLQLRDVTAEHSAQEQAQEQADAAGRDASLEASRRQLQLFADAVAHDLRAPLRSIESFSSLLAHRSGDALDEAGRDHLARIRNAAARMSGLLSALGDLSRATGAELCPGPVDISLLADWAAAELRDADPDRQAEVAVQPGLVAHGDERLLKLLLTQLLDNAMKFSHERPLALIEVGGSNPGGALRLFVRDNGSGFDPRYLHKLFQPFQRLHGPDEGGGHGLGLAIAQRIAERHDGRLHAESEPGVGSTFHLELPGAPD